MSTQLWIGLTVCIVALVATISVIIYAISRVGNVHVTLGLIALVFLAGVLTVLITLWFIGQSGLLPT